MSKPIVLGKIKNVVLMNEKEIGVECERGGGLFFFSVNNLSAASYTAGNFKTYQIDARSERALINFIFSKGSNRVQQATGCVN